MPLKPLFGGFEPAIRQIFLTARNEAGGASASVELVIDETAYHSGSARAEFLVFDPSGPVRITWNGIASLWAVAQGAGRLSRRMFEGKRSGQKALAVKTDPEAERGLYSLEMAKRLLISDVPHQVASIGFWPDWAPPINIAPTEDSDDYTGNRLFFGALAWIIRHELAHVFLQHARREVSEGLTRKAAEIEADHQATVWLRSSLQADQARKAGTIPGATEIQLEGRAIGIGMGLIWVALFEAGHGHSQDYPPLADRLFACLDELGLREDSAAAEVLSDIIQAWIGPEEQWSPPEGYSTAAEALNDAVFRLHRFLT